MNTANTIDQADSGGAILWQRVEGLLLFAAGIAIFWQLGGMVPWWAAALLFFAPDLAFFGYLFGPRVGAVVYNSVHIYAFGGAFLALGFVLAMPMLSALGALWLAHSAFDRMLGYGLKLPQGFGFTHLGRVGKRKA